MRDPRRQKFGPYVRLLADLMGLRDWKFTIFHDEPENKEHEACCLIPEGLRVCNIRFSDAFLDRTPEEQRETIVHELQHCHLELFKKGVMKAVSPAEWRILQMLFEAAVEDSSIYASKLLPLPTWANAKTTDKVPKVPKKSGMVRNRRSGKKA